VIPFLVEAVHAECGVADRGLSTVVDHLAHAFEPRPEAFGAQQKAVNVAVRDRQTGLEERTPVDVDLRVSLRRVEVEVHPPVAGVVHDQ